jgi:hypothetical protein
MDDDDNEGEKILTIEDFKKRALEKLEVLHHFHSRQKNSRT